MAAVLLLLTACGGASEENGSNAEKDGLNGKVHKVQTLTYNAVARGDKIVKNGKPNVYGEEGIFPIEDTRIYDAAGKLDSTVYVVDAIKYVTVYAHQDGKVSNEKVYQNGTLVYDRSYVYEDGCLKNMIEDNYTNGDKTTNEYPVDGSKIEYKDGNIIEHGYSERDYVVKDASGRILKQSYYNEMEDYLTVREYTYNEKGWLTAISTEGEGEITYEYTDVDNEGNWIRQVIRLDGEPYGITERNITYHE